MRTKWLLIALPLGILALLFQSAFWVPTYTSQAEGNPGRLVTYVRATLGDAKYLNPVVSSDRFAAEVFERNIFEGLLDEDANRRVMPGLAQRYETTEEAFLAVLPDRKLADGTPASARALLTAVETAWKAAKPGRPLSSIQRVELVPPETRKTTKTALVRNAKGREDPVDVEVTIDVPERVKMTLGKVEPRLFEELEPTLGASYFQNYPFESRFRVNKPEQLGMVRRHFEELLPIGEHNPVLTFHLRPNVRWHDGVPFSAEDVKFTYQAAINPKNASRYAASFDNIKGVDVVDELTARVTYKRLYAPGIIDWMLHLVPKHLLDAAALAREADRRRLSGAEREKLSVRTSEFNRKPVGTGPFHFTQWLPDQYIHLRRNDAYWGEKAQYRDLYFRIIPDYLTMELELQAGALDIYDALPHQAERYRHDDNYQVLPFNEGYYSYIAYNMRRPPFDDVRVRKALGMALDVDSIIRYVLSGEGKRSTGPYYSNTPYYDPDIKPLPYDPKAATALLEDAGFRKNARGMLERGGKPFAFTLVTNNGNPQRKAIMLIAQEAWRKLGIDCKVQVFEWTVFIEQFVHVRNFDAFVLAWGSGAINFDKFTFWHSSQVGNYKNNAAGYQDPEVDRLLIQIQETYDEKELIQLTRKLHRMIADAQPTTFLYEPLRPLVIDKRIAFLEHAASGQQLIRRLQSPPSGDTFRFLPLWRKFSGVPTYSEQ
ncbi:MAG TPA: ABC transporter substrate-binding protein [Polyangiaceae bacterium]|nr:ABC transporter substrate-binding protein [Polyangiaceae bacterium]